MTVSLWQDQSSERTVRTDFLVVGAGISGASAAYWLAERGERVTVVEAGAVAQGASGRSGGMLLLGTADPYARVVDLFGRERAREIWSFTNENRRLLEERVLAGVDARALRLVRSGTVSAAVSAHELSEVRRSGAWLVEDGFPHEEIDEATLRAALGGSESFLGGLRDPHGLTVDPARLTARILALAVERGAEVIEHAPVFRLEQEHDGAIALARTARFEAEMILVCVNAYAPLLHAHFEGKVYPTRGQMLATEPLPARVVPFGIYADFGYEYFWQLDSGEVVAGGWRQHARDAERGYSDETTHEIQEGIWSFLVRAVPALEGKRVTHRWGGVMGFSADGLPFVGELPGKPRIKVLAGHTGHGLGFAFHAARRLVDTAIEGTELGWLGAGRRTLTGA